MIAIKLKKDTAWITTQFYKYLLIYCLLFPLCFFLFNALEVIWLVVKNQKVMDGH